MREKWTVGDKVYTIDEWNYIKEVTITVVGKGIRVSGGNYSWGMADDSNLFRTEEEAKQRIQEKAERWKKSHDSKEQVLKVLFDAAIDTHSEQQILALRELIQKHFDIRVPYNE